MRNTKTLDQNNLKALESISKLLTNGDLYKARKFLLEYQDKYPGTNSFICNSIEARLIGYEGDFDEAISVFKSVLNQKRKSNNFSESIYYLMILLLKQGRYDEAYHYCNMIDYKELENKPARFTTNTIRTYNFLKKELNLDSDVYDIESYSMLQLYYYSNYLAKEHIYEKHNIDTNVDIEYSHYSFNMNYETFERLYSIINSTLPYAERTFEYTCGDIYYFRVKDVGVNLQEGFSTDILKVITNNGSFEIVSMFPEKNQKNSNRVINDIITEPIVEYHSIKKRKVVSQIDKFNSRYSLQK